MYCRNPNNVAKQNIHFYKAIYNTQKYFCNARHKTWSQNYICSEFSLTRVTPCLCYSEQFNKGVGIFLGVDFSRLYFHKNVSLIFQSAPKKHKWNVCIQICLTRFLHPWWFPTQLQLRLVVNLFVLAPQCWPQPGDDEASSPMQVSAELWDEPGVVLKFQTKTGLFITCSSKLKCSINCFKIQIDLINLGSF